MRHARLISINTIIMAATNKSIKEYKQRRRKRDERRKAILTICLICVLAILVVWAYRALAENQNRPTPFPNAPTPAGASIEDLCEVRISDSIPSIGLNYTAMSMSFNPELHIPNYVVWELTRDEVYGDIGRSNSFQPDPDVSSSANVADYKGSGFDRGHMMPAADAKHSPQAMVESFYLTNICPQAPQLNQGSWKTLEEKCRVWADVDSAIIIICGPVIGDHLSQYIGETEVAVPERFFKVILSPYANPPRAIGFIMPNGKVPGGIQSAAVSVNEVERITGYDFFAALPDEIEEKIEDECKFNYWSNLRK